MARRLKRAWLARATVVAAVCALPLISVGSAQAAIAGANPTVTANPNLVSATVTSVIPAKVRICFDKPIADTSGVFDASNFNKVELTGYRSANKVLATGVSWDGALTGGNPDCITANFNVSGSGDINQFTAVTVLGEQGNGGFANYTNIVVASSNGRDNISDSVPLTGSATHNGTAGNTTAPDLVGVTTPDGAKSQITYVFNKAVLGPFMGTPDPIQFFYENGGGQVCTGDGSTTPTVTNSATGFTVTVTFPSVCVDQNGHAVTVLDAIRAGTFQDFGAAVALSDNNAPNPLETVIVPNQTGQTSLPDLTGAKMFTDFNTVSYTFNQPIAANSIRPADFTVFNSDGSWLVGCSANIGGSNTVNVLFSQPDGDPCSANDTQGEAGPRTLKNQAEYAVLAAVDGIAVEGSQNNTVDQFNSCQNPTGGHPGCRDNTLNSIEYTDSPGSTPIGDNAGAFARGFTTGPDAFATTINQVNGVVTLTFDQRIIDWDSEAICVYRADGTLGGCDPIVTPTTFPGPGPQTVTMQFLPAQVTNGVAVQILGSSALNRGLFAFETDLQSQTSRHDAYNIPQALSPIGSGAKLRAVKVTHRKHHSRKHHRR
jgi:hypothetical protein